MSEAIETMGQLLGAEGHGLNSRQVEILSSCPELAALRAALALVPDTALADLSHGVGDALKPVLDLQVGDVLAGGWNVGRDLFKYRDKTKYPPQDVFQHPLNEHSIDTSFRPAIQVWVNQVPVPNAKIEFTITLKLTIESAVLRIRDAHIIGATIATCKGTATLKCGKAILMERSTGKFSLPTVGFGDGVLIG
jgi:hypothetical protein